MTEPLKTYCQELVWFDDIERGNYFAVVLAPDDETARRVIAAEMLDAGSDNLFELFGHDDQAPKTLEHYYRQHGELGAWGDVNGHACPNCTSHAGRENGAIHAWTTGQAKVFECTACGYEWVPLGFGAKRKALEDAARTQIAQLDEIERESASGEDETIEPSKGDW